MREVAHALRQAMADEVASVEVPAELAARVRSRHHRRRRRRALASLAGVAATVAATPVVLTAVLPSWPPPADPPAAVDSVDGVELAYLPDGLERDPVDGFDFGGGAITENGWTRWTAVTARWRPRSHDPGEPGGYHRGVRLSVFRGAQVGSLRALAREVVAEGAQPPAEQDGRIVARSPVQDGDGEWVDVFWRATDGVSLRVRVSEDLEPELARIVDGVRLVGDGDPPPFGADRDSPPPEVGLCAPETNREIAPGAGRHDWLGYGGVTVSYVPAGLSDGSFSWSIAASGLVDTAESGRWSYRFDWRFPGDDGRPFTVRVTCGDRAPQDPESLQRFLAGTGAASAPEPYPMAGGVPAFTVDGHLYSPSGGRRVAWLPRPGAVVEVSLVEGIADELDEVVDGIRLDRPGPPARARFADLPTGWSELPAPPQLRHYAATGWTGEQLLLWSGTVPRSHGQPEPGGFGFDTGTGRWRELAPSPLAPRLQPAAAWTGSELLVWGGAEEEGRSAWFDDGAAYDPASDTWRRLPPAPLSARAPLSVWTGSELIVWGTAQRRTDIPTDGAAYDPATDSWRRIAGAPIELTDATAAWTGREMIVFGAALRGGNHSATRTAIGAAYDPVADSWRRLPDSRLSPQASTAAWNGTELIAWDYLGAAAAYDPATDRWRSLPGDPLGSGECGPRSVPVGDQVVGLFCFGAVVHDGGDGSWQVISRAETGWWSELIAAGPVAVLLAKDVPGGEEAALAYRPQP